MHHPVASISLDLDDKWAFLKTRGEKKWSSFPSFFPESIPVILDFLKQRDCKITFFIIGQDAALPHNNELMMAIAEHGHEIGNHTFHHDPWIQRYSLDEVNNELSRAEEVIEAATGQVPKGFRGPAFTFSPNLLTILKRRGYAYDASTLPNLLNPLSRAYFFMSSGLTPEQKEERQLVFGNAWDALRPLRPYKWKLDNNEFILEIPVTTFPFFKIPIHLTYILYLSKYSVKLALTYFQTAIEIARLRKMDISLLLSPTDFLGKEDHHEIPFFPAMDIPRGKKIELLNEVMSIVQRKFPTKTMIEHSQIAESRINLREVTPKR